MHTGEIPKSIQPKIDLLQRLADELSDYNQTEDELRDALDWAIGVLQKQEDLRQKFYKSLTNPETIEYMENYGKDRNEDSC